MRDCFRSRSAPEPEECLAVSAIAGKRRAPLKEVPASAAIKGPPTGVLRGKEGRRALAAREIDERLANRPGVRRQGDEFRPPTGFKTETFKCFRTDFRTDGFSVVITT